MSFHLLHFKHELQKYNDGELLTPSQAVDKGDISQPTANFISKANDSQLEEARSNRRILNLPNDIVLWANRKLFVPRVFGDLVPLGKVVKPLGFEQAAFSGNELFDQGKEILLDVFLNGDDDELPAEGSGNFKLRLYNESAPAATDTAATLTGEPGSGGYTAQDIPRNKTTKAWTIALTGGDQVATGTQETFTGDATGYTIKIVVLAESTGTTSGDKVYCWQEVNSGSALTINSSQSYKCTMKVEMQTESTGG